MKKLVGVVCAVMVACGDIHGSFDAADRYVLRSIAGESVPAIFISNAFTVHRILADTIALAADGTGADRQVVEIFDAGLNETEVFTVETPLTHRVSNGRLEITYECPDNLSCAPPPHLAGRATGSGLEFEVTLGRAPMVFERLSR